MASLWEITSDPMNLLIRRLEGEIEEARSDWDELEIMVRETLDYKEQHQAAIIGYDYVGDRYVFVFELPTHLQIIRLVRAGELGEDLSNRARRALRSMPRNLAPMA
jgi:hypothetical protein